jgi:exopolysaccharide biosynthesis polyprenyl glycosylphosphotransferase
MSAPVLSRGSLGKEPRPDMTNPVRGSTEAVAAAATADVVSAPARRRGRSQLTRALVGADVAALVLAMAVVEALYGASGGHGNRLALAVEALVFLGTLPAWLVAAKLFRLYDRDDERADHSTVDDLTSVFLVITVGAWLLFVGATLTHIADPGLVKLVTFWALAIAFVTVGRSIARAVFHRSNAYVQNTVIVGAGEVGQRVARKLMQHREYGINLLGFVDASPRRMRPGLDGVPVLGGPDRLLEIVRERGVERVVVAFSLEPTADLIDTVIAVRRAGVQVDIVPRLFEALSPHVKMHSIEGVPMIALPTNKRFPFSAALKRTLDVVVAVAAGIVALPFVPYAVWRIKRESPGPVLFRQTRLGQGMREFTVFKFRTMRTDTDPAAHAAYIAQTMSNPEAAAGRDGLFKLDQESAVTPFGRWLRRTSLDELPQFLNVLRGDMSLVGPRPCLPYEVEHFRTHHYERFGVPPGITGLWQVTARAHTTFGEALDMDVAYARGWSLGLDAWLICRTPLHMLRGDATT